MVHIREIRDNGFHPTPHLLGWWYKEQDTTPGEKDADEIKMKDSMVDMKEEPEKSSNQYVSNAKYLKSTSLAASSQSYWRELHTQVTGLETWWVSQIVTLE